MLLGIRKYHLWTRTTIDLLQIFTRNQQHDLKNNDFGYVNILEFKHKGSHTSGDISINVFWCWQDFYKSTFGNTS